jgi:CBS domain-containing protein
MFCMKVKDIMIRDVITVAPEDSFADVIETFSRKKISGAPVVEGRKPVGMVSESDIMKQVSKKDIMSLIDGDNKDVKEKMSMKVKDLMTKNIISVKPDDEVREVIRMMNEKDVNRLPVIEKGELRGIVTRADVVSVVCEYLCEHPMLKKKEHESENPALETNIDTLLALVKEKESVKFSEAAKKFNVPESKIEEWGNILEEYGLVRLHYPPIGTPMLKILKEKRHEKKKQNRED